MFKLFSSQVHQNFTMMAAESGKLFRASVPGDSIWQKYLESFPPGTDPIYKTHTEHTCSCCKHFIRNIGNVVSISADYELNTIWNCKDLPEPYATVAKALHEFVIGNPGTLQLFAAEEPQYGADVTRQLLEDGVTVKSWNHFYVRTGVFNRGHKTASEVGKYATDAHVFRRGLKEISKDSVDTILELITANQLYRGQEKQLVVSNFAALQSKYAALPEDRRELFVVKNAKEHGSQLFSDVIGKLLVEISEGTELEKAVNTYAERVSPGNYQRVTSLATPKMVERALVTIKELGYEDSIPRRLANKHDVTVNNMLWVSADTSAEADTSLAKLLLSATRTQPTSAKGHAGTHLSAATFAETIAPRAKRVQVLLQREHLNRFVTLTAPVNKDAKSLFKWDNGFAWSYSGNVTDSIKEKVKRAGGNTDNARLRVSLAWHNYDDLDLHARCPNGHIYFMNKRGILDVDMNAGGRQSREPVENLSWREPSEGKYSILVDQFHRRETENVGFELQVEYDGVVTEYAHLRAATERHELCLTFEIKNGKMVDLVVAPALTAETRNASKWGLTTGGLVDVDRILLSPNFWDGNDIGNLHWMFILKGCKTDEETRGVYNEFLKSELNEHRKVFELIGNKTKCPTAQEQLSGIGFSSTLPGSVSVRVEFEDVARMYEIMF